MTASRTIIALAAAALGSGLAWSPLAQAQSSGTSSVSPNAPAATPSPAANNQSAKPRGDAQVEARITQLHRDLKITPAQESQWSSVAQDMRDNAHEMSSLIQQRTANGKAKPMSAVDNLKSYEQIAEAHADGLKKIAPDFEKLYDAMSPAQKKTADTVFNQRVNQRVRTTGTPSSGGHS
jgi:periplasmic protein CpxP/Spy